MGSEAELHPFRRPVNSIMGSTPKSVEVARAAPRPTKKLIVPQATNIFLRGPLNPLRRSGAALRCA